MNQETTPQSQDKESSSPLKAPLTKTDQQTDSLEEIYKRISEDFKEVVPLHAFAKKLNMESGQLILIIIMFAFLLTIIGAGSSLVNIVVGMLYPMYMSIKTLTRNNSVENKQWIAYWILFSSSLLLDRVIWYLLFQFQSIYHPLKTMIWIWLYYPRTQGARIVYDKYIATNIKLIGISGSKKNI